MFQSCWGETGSTYMTRLKSRTLGAPRVLNDVSWQLELQLAQKTATKLTTPCAVFEFNTSNPSGYEETDAEKFQVEFTHEELFDFFTKIEKIQSQVDKLGYSS